MPSKDSNKQTRTAQHPASTTRNTKQGPQRRGTQGTTGCHCVPAKVCDGVRPFIQSIDGFNKLYGAPFPDSVIKCITPVRRNFRSPADELVEGRRASY